MRIQINIPPHLAERLRQLAMQEHRYPRQQAEVLLYQALRSPVDFHDTPPEQEIALMAGEPGP